MSEIAVFIVGIVVFAITICGVVVAGGLAMQSVEHAQNPRSYGDNGEPPTTEHG
jgi:hypothetical protein